MIDVRTKRLFPSLLILGCFLVLAIGPSTCYATEVWSDNFDDGDCDGWTGRYYGGDPLWTAAEKHLQLDQEEIGIITYDSTVTTGTWSADIQTCETTDLTNPYDVVIYFMLEGIPSSDPSDDWTGYAFQISPAQVGDEFIHVFSIRKKSAEIRSATRALVLDSYDGETVGRRWHHIDVTRTSNGQITAFLNGTQILQAVDTDYEASEYFALVSTQHQCFDNVMVDDQPLPVGLSWEILVLGTGVAAIIIVAAVIVKRRG
ncbi:MAG: family 16 glycoside hydrolase [Candidatus Thorarchaeota archaeon]